MANPEHLKILKQGVEKWNTWRKTHPIVEPDLSEVDLAKELFGFGDLESRANHSFNLLYSMYKLKTGHTALLRHGAPDLSYADLSHADLHGAEFFSGMLRYADLRGACLNRANFRGADLSGADASEATLGDANLRGAWLNGANLAGAKLHGTEFTWADMNETDLEPTLT